MHWFIIGIAVYIASKVIVGWLTPMILPIVVGLISLFILKHS